MITITEKDEKYYGKLLCETAKILDIPPKHATLIKDEAHRKIRGTYLVLNSELVLMKEVNFPDNSVTVKWIKYKEQGKELIWVGQDKIIKADKIEYMQPWFPEIGTYQLPCGELLFLTKVTRKQWFKSFYTNYYSFIFEDNSNYIGDTSQIIYCMFFNKRPVTTIAANKFGDIYYNGLKVGYIVPGKIVCFDYRYEQELIDWSRK